MPAASGDQAWTAMWIVDDAAALASAFFSSETASRPPGTA